MTLAVHHSSRAFALLFSAICAGACPLAAEPAATQVSTISARDAGARYGQALGALEVCSGAKITAKAHALSATYAAADQDAFKAQTAKIFDAWIKVKGCTDQGDPNTCKIVMDKSCLAAAGEIGASAALSLGLWSSPSTKLAALRVRARLRSLALVPAPPADMAAAF